MLPAYKTQTSNRIHLFNNVQYILELVNYIHNLQLVAHKFPLRDSRKEIVLVERTEHDLTGKVH